MCGDAETTSRKRTEREPVVVKAESEVIRDKVDKGWCRAEGSKHLSAILNPRVLVGFYIPCWGVKTSFLSTVALRSLYSDDRRPIRSWQIPYPERYEWVWRPRADHYLHSPFTHYKFEARFEVELETVNSGIRKI